MAKPVSEDTRHIEGLLVYEPYAPEKPGVIIEDLGWTTKPFLYRRCLWRNINGEVQESRVSSLRHLDFLIRDHARKAQRLHAKGRELLEKFQKSFAENQKQSA